MEKCNKDGCCNHLAERLGDGGKGFKALYTVRRDSNVTRFLGVAYKTSAKDNGLLLNRCPFCGGQPGYFERDANTTANVELSGLRRPYGEAPLERRVGGAVSPEQTFGE